MKLTIKMQMPERPVETKHSLKDRVEYACWCMEAGHNFQNALEFLRKAKKHLEAKHPFEREDQDLLELIQSTIMDWGHYH